MKRLLKTRAGVLFSAAAVVLPALALTPCALGGSHPSLLLGPADLPRLRHACGLAPPPAGQPGGRAGARAPEFQALRTYMNAHDGGDILPGEVSAAAFLHLVDPHDPHDIARLTLISRALREPIGLAHDPFETVLALDWCWDDLEPAARTAFLCRLAGWSGPLASGDSPLDHRTFSAKLTLLAAALAFDETDAPEPLWRSTRRRVLAAARTYFRETWPVFLRWRGAAPTSPSAGPAEERDAALATELASRLLGQDLWSDPATSVARWLEHYVYASFAHPALQHHFIRDDGSAAPLSPAPTWEEMLPLTAHLIAVRTADPAAAFIARRVTQRLHGPTAERLARPWQWVPIVCDTGRLACCDFSRLPPTRNFGGAVVFRAGTGNDEVGIWIEAGQPLLRPRQHCDAGHFLIYSRGHLAVGGGDDIAFEAVPSKGGYQRLGRQKGRFDFDQYFAATIAHNCLLLWDRVRVPRWHGQRYEAVGGQRLIENTCTEFTPPLEGNPRQTGRQLAYGRRGPVSYLALDLTPAYERRIARSCTREFVFWEDRALLVIDRVSAARPRVRPVWILNLPARPQADGADLTALPQLFGDDDGGVWLADEVRELRWRDGEGAAKLVPLLPEPRRMRIVGGPATPLVIPAGPHAGRTYVGGSPESFEHRLRPIRGVLPPNAWYRLGEPTVLGPVFGRSPHWGRLEVEPAGTADGAQLFISALFIENDPVSGQPAARIVEDDDGLIVSLAANRTELTLKVPAGTAWGGSFSVDGGEPQPLPDHIEPDPPLACEAGDVP